MQTAPSTPAAPAPQRDIPAVVHTRARVQCRACGLQHDEPAGCPQCVAQTPHVAVIRSRVAA